MSMLGIKASEDALDQYGKMKLRKGDKIVYLTFKISGSKIVVDKSVKISDVKDKEDYLDEFIACTKETGEPRFAVVDHNHKMLFVGWIPDTAKAADKMKYASIKESFVQELDGIQLKLQATDDGEFSKKNITEKTKSKV